MSKIRLAVYHLTNGATYREKDLMSTWGSSEQESYVVVGDKIRELYHEVASCENDGDWDGWTKERYYLGIIKEEETEEYDWPD